MNILTKIFTFLTSILSRVHLVKKKDTLHIVYKHVDVKVPNDDEHSLSHCDKRTESSSSLLEDKES